MILCVVASAYFFSDNSSIDFQYITVSIGWLLIVNVTLITNIGIRLYYVSIGKESKYLETAKDKMDEYLKQMYKQTKAIGKQEGWIEYSKTNRQSRHVTQRSSSNYNDHTDGRLSLKFQSSLHSRSISKDVLNDIQIKDKTTSKAGNKDTAHAAVSVTGVNKDDNNGNGNGNSNIIIVGNEENGNGVKFQATSTTGQSLSVGGGSLASKTGDDDAAIMTASDDE